jgi:hypothetical protein
MSLDFNLSRIQRTTVFTQNITHNLTKMASEAGIYVVLWTPTENGYSKAWQIVPELKAGLKSLKEDPDRFKQFNAPNGWGLYEHFVPFVEEVLSACEQYPDADIDVSV